MSDSKTFAVVDVGSNKVAALVIESSADSERGYSVIGVGVAPSRGIRRGVVVNVADATDSIRDAVNGAEQSSGVAITNVIMSLNGSHIDSQNSQGAVAIGRSDDGVGEDDISRGLEAAQAITLPSNRDLMHALARNYKVDDHEGVRDPRGMLGFRLEVQAHIVTASASAIQNLSKCASGAGLVVDQMVPAGMASAQAVLTAAEREMGTVLVDIGGGTTSIVVYIEGTAWHSHVLDVGGQHFSKDLAMLLRIPLDTAEQLKMTAGTLAVDSVLPESFHELPGFGDEASVRVLQRDVAEILRARAVELFGLIEKEIKRSGYDGMLTAGIVVTGGSALLPGLRDVAREVSSRPVRVARPLNLVGLVDSIQTPAFSTVVGLADWGQSEQQGRPQRRAKSNLGTFSMFEGRGRLRSFFKWLLPRTL